jgi:xeroderma pigmentosum group C-complementing protein
MISRSWSQAEELYMIPENGDGKGKAKGTVQEDAFLQLLESGEPIHGAKSLMKRALLMKGSKDMSAQLFTSCLRALDIPARLVFSLQPVTWRGAGSGGKSANPSAAIQKDTAPGGSTAPNISKSKAIPRKGKADSVAAQKSKQKAKRGEWATKAEKAARAIKAKSTRADDRTPHFRVTNDEDDEGNSSVKSLPEAMTASSSVNSPVIKLRKSRPPAKSRNWAKSPSPEPQEMIRPPVFWTEVYSRPMKEWYCVDVTRKKMRCKSIMEPSRNNPENKMIYVIAYEEGNHSFLSFFLEVYHPLGLCLC